MAVISKFREKPKMKTTWSAMWLGLASLLVFPMLGISAAVIVPFADRTAGEAAGVAVGVAVAASGVLLSVAAFVAAVRAYRRGERSWVMWLGFLPAMFVALSWALMILGEVLMPH